MLGVRSKRRTLGVRVLLAVGLLFVGGLLGALVLKPKSAESLKVTSGLFTLYTRAGKTWQQAEAFCNARGLHLATINGWAELKEVRAILCDAHMRLAWIGYNDLSNEGHFQWVDGSQSTYTHWVVPQLRKHEGHCVEMMSSNLDGTWNDIDCESDGIPGFVCKKTQFVVFQSAGISWTDASDECESAGMVLATIDDATENAEVWSLIDAQSMTSAWIGFNDRATEGVFQWADGGRIRNAYTNWYPGEPDNHRGKEHCVEMYTRNGVDGKWNDARCGDWVDGYVCVVL